MPTAVELRSCRTEVRRFSSASFRLRLPRPLILSASSPADIVIGVKGVKIAFPEVLVGVCAGVGGIPNSFARSPQLAPYLFTGAPIPTHILETHVLTEVVDKPEDVLMAALKWAKQITLASPESVWLTKEQINLHKAGRGINDVVVESFESPLSKALYRGDNIKEGLRSFTEVRFLSLLLTFPAPLELMTLSCRNASRYGGTHRGSRASRSCRRRGVSPECGLVFFAIPLCFLGCERARCRAGPFRSTTQSTYNSRPLAFVALVVVPSCVEIAIRAGFVSLFCLPARSSPSPSDFPCFCVNHSYSLPG